MSIINLFNTLFFVAILILSIFFGVQVAMYSLDVKFEKQVIAGEVEEIKNYVKGGSFSVSGCILKIGMVGEKTFSGEICDGISTGDLICESTHLHGGLFGKTKVRFFEICPDELLKKLGYQEELEE